MSESEDEKSGEMSEDGLKEESLPISKREMPNRTTRGKRYFFVYMLKDRMHELIGKALEEDEQFWNQFGFREAESDEDYVESSEGIDKVDSDFDKPEEEEEEEEVDSKSTKERDHKKKTIVIPKKKPHKPQPTEQSESQQVKKNKRMVAEVSLPMEQRSVKVREKTIEQTKEAQKRFAEWEKKQIEKEQKKQDEPKVMAPEKLTQIEQMKEAAMNEEENLKSLELLKQIELTKQKQGYKKKEVALETVVRSNQTIVNGKFSELLLGVKKTMIIVPNSEHIYTGANNKASDTSKSNEF